MHDGKSHAVHVKGSVNIAVTNCVHECACVCVCIRGVSPGVVLISPTSSKEAFLASGTTSCTSNGRLAQMVAGQCRYTSGLGFRV